MSQLGTSNLNLNLGSSNLNLGGSTPKNSGSL
jgi:hypothetical protein